MDFFKVIIKIIHIVAPLYIFDYSKPKYFSKKANNLSIVGISVAKTTALKEVKVFPDPVV